MSKPQLHTGYPVCQRVLAFLESPVLFQISLRHFIQACFTFLTTVNFSLKKEIFLVRTLHLFTCIYSQVFLYLRHIVVLNRYIYVTAPFFP